MSEIGLNKRSLLYQQIAAQHSAQAASVRDPFIGHQAQQPQQPNPAWLKKVLLATGVVLLLHASVWYIAKQLPTKPLPEPVSEPVVIEIVKPLPKEEPPKVIEPEVVKPKIPPVTKKPEIPPVVQKPQPVKKVEQQPIQKPTPTPTPQVVEQPVVQPVISENVRPVPTPTPAPTPAPVAQPVEQNLPVTEAKGYAGYLSNPAPDYPEIALERGWEGSVILRVKVSPSGSPLSVNVKQGSGRKVLDDAAVRTVKRWKFSPALRGSTPIEGWVDVPIDYRLPS